MRPLFTSFCVSVLFLGLLLTSLAEPAMPHPEHPPVVDILLFDGVEIIDYSGPWEVFGHAGYRVCAVAESLKPITTGFGEKVMPAYTFADAPKPDILLIPGGDVSDRLLDNPKVIQWIRDNAADARSVVSVCTGAFLLARAGLLDGLTATTYHSAISSLAEMAVRTKVVSGRRYVDNGKVVTTAGISAGIDGALHVVEKLDGRPAAETAAEMMEYDWNPRLR